MTKQKKVKETNRPWINNYVESVGIIAMLMSWKGLDVLEIGCGTGDLASMLDYAGAKVTAIDRSKTAIKTAKEKFPRLADQFYCCDVAGANRYDVIVMQGVLEHIEKPWEFLEKIIKENLKADKISYVITSSPAFCNPRGYVWMTLQLLFDAKMSLADKHFFSPFDFAEFGRKNEYQIELTSLQEELGAGPEMIEDLKERLPKVLTDDVHPVALEKIDALIDWLEKTLNYFKPNQFSGANIVYRIPVPPKKVN